MRSDRWSYLKHMWYPYYLTSLNHLITGEQCLIKTRTWKVKPAWNRHKSRTVAMVTAQWVSFCVLPDVHYWWQVWMASLKHFQRYSWFCDLSSYLNHWWCHQFLSKTLNIWGIKEDLSKKKMPFLLTLKAFRIGKYNFLLHRHFKNNVLLSSWRRDQR